MRLEVFKDPEAELRKLPATWLPRIIQVRPYATGCWLWNGALSYQGEPGNGDRDNPELYGRVTFRAVDQQKATNWLAHRASWSIIVGPIGKDELGQPLVLDHLFGPWAKANDCDRCSMRRCIRPDHLESVTRIENNRRGFSLWPSGGRWIVDHGGGVREDDYD